MRQNFSDDLSPSTLSRVRRLINDERFSSGVKEPEARRNIAKDAGIAPGSLERLLSGRLKNIDRIAGALNALVERRIEREIGRLQHELFLVRKARSSPQADLDKVEALLAEAKRALGR